MCWHAVLCSPFSLDRCVEPLREKSSFHLQEEARGYDAACSVAVAVLSPLCRMAGTQRKKEAVTWSGFWTRPAARAVSGNGVR